jgi:hypothetical protein
MDGLCFKMRNFLLHLYVTLNPLCPLRQPACTGEPSRLAVGSLVKFDWETNWTQLP